VAAEGGRVGPAYGERMNLSEFKGSLAKTKPPAKLSPALAALWWAGKDQWDKAHRIVMDEAGKDCAWVHAYLHRVEGDLSNARYWYRQAGRAVATEPLQAEWDTIAEMLLAAGRSRSPD
jgi:hypothetical protein